ncbi:MAG: HEAT repeat domain-containing protein [Myxococcota bacterium]
MSDAAIDYDGASMPELMELMSGEDPGARADAACAIGDRLRTREIGTVDSTVRDRLAALLEDPVPMVKLEAAIALAEAKDTRATDLLLEAAGYRRFRLDAIRSLGTLGDEKAVPALTRIMERLLMPWADKLQAAAALCALGDQDGATYLEQRLRSRRFAERAAAVHFLGESRHPNAFALLTEILNASGHELRDVAARALGLLGDPRAKEALQEIRKNADEGLREDIDTALRQIDLAGQ